MEHRAPLARRPETPGLLIPNPRHASPATPRHPPMDYYLGIDLGGSSVKAAVVATEGILIDSIEITFVDHDMEWARRIRSLVDTVSQRRGPPLGIGLSAPGLAAPDGRSIAHMPGRLLGLEGLDWTRYLDATIPIPVLNDAHAALMGEAWLGAARNRRNAFMLTLGTGVGGAAMVDGRLLKGRIGRAGHLGHVTVDFQGPLDDVHTPGSLELEIGNKTITRRSGGRFATTHALVEAFRSGDPDAAAIWQRSIQALGAAVASLINVLDPEAVIIGGGIARAGDILFRPLRLCLDQYEWRPGGTTAALVPAELGEIAGAVGAAWTAHQAHAPKS